MTSSGCDTCDGHLHPGARVTLAFFAVIALGVGGKLTMRKLNKHRKYDNILRHIGELVVVIFDFLQIAGSIGSLYSVRMPIYIRQMFSDANVVNFDVVGLLGLNCLGTDVTFYASFTLMMMVPFISCLPQQLCRVLPLVWSRKTVDRGGHEGEGPTLHLHAS